MDRGRYAAPVGWTSADGDGEWAIALRCGLFEGARARLYAGAGIVEGSLPEQELQETWLKLRAMREVIGA
jgi:menaquinone-specific isochorismate synthase